MNPALPTASPAYGPDRPSDGATVDNATTQGSTYFRGNPVQTNGATSINPLKYQSTMRSFQKLKS